MKAATFNVLLTCIGRNVFLVRAFQKALRDLGLKGNIVTTDASQLAAGLYHSDRFYVVPKISDPNYLDTLKEIVTRECISLLLPAKDSELALFARERSNFAELGTTVAVSGEAAIETCNDKVKTCQFYLDHGVPTCKLYPLEDFLEGKTQAYPVVVKGRGRYGETFGYYLASTLSELRTLAQRVPDATVAEYLQGQEYTIDVLSDLKGRVLGMVPRERLAVREWVSDKGRTIWDQGLLETVCRIAESLALVGPSNLQCIKHEGTYKFIDINPRYSGGLHLSLAAGLDVPGVLVRLTRGEKVDSRVCRYKAGLYMVRYEDAVFISEEELHTPRGGLS